MTEKESRYQFTFLTEQGDFSSPTRIVDYSGGEKAVLTIEQRKLWEERPVGNCLHLNLAEGQKGGLDVFNPINWQILERQKTNFAGREKYSALMIIAPPLDQENIARVGVVLDSVRGLLKKQSPVYVFEEKSEYLEKEQKLSILEKAGFVQRRVLTGLSGDFDVWESRVKKERKRKPINLIAPGYSKIDYMRGLWRKMERHYGGYDFKIVNKKESPILIRLRSSTFPLDDIGRLRHYWGVEIRGTNCICHSKIDVNGVETSFKKCGKDHGHLLSRKRKSEK